MNKSEEKKLYGVLFVVAVLVIIWKVDALVAFIANALLAAIGVGVAFISGKKLLELNK